MYCTAELLTTKPITQKACYLASAAIPIIFDVDVNGIPEVTAEFLRFLLRKSIAGDNCELR